MSIRPHGIDRRRVVAAGLMLFAGHGVRAQSSARPLLEIFDPAGRVTVLDEAAISALPWHEIRTHTRWTDGVQHFRGPLLRDVLLTSGSRAELKDRTLEMRALNEFEVQVPGRDAWAYDTVLAREMNGKLMRVRDKGPLWLVYPRDDTPELQDPQLDARWIWQLSEIHIL